jgi:hypothetical protein
MSANQLIGKALSTTSEDEAIACLRMARKKGLKIDAAKVAKVDQARDEEWARLVTQAREESYKYYRMLQEQINTTQKVKRDLKEAINGQIFIAVSTLIVTSACWSLLFLLYI